jgi:hypothetical protein
MYLKSVKPWVSVYACIEALSAVFCESRLVTALA